MPRLEAWKMPRVIRWVLTILNGTIFLLKGVCPGFNNHWFTGCMIAWFIIAGLDVWYLRRDLR